MIASKLSRQILKASKTSFTKPSINNYIHSSGALQAKVALVLSGCGVYDGTEIHEASACMVHLSRGGAETSYFAPNLDQHHVIDHTKGEPSNESRNMMVEAARISRGNIQNIKELKQSDFDAVIFPGGFGAVKNLSNYGLVGNDYKVNEDVTSILQAFHTAKKPIGFCCIAPMLAVRNMPGIAVTIGKEEPEGGRYPYAHMTQSVKDLGCTHVPKDATEAFVDEKNKIASTPAYMCETALHEIHDGIGKMINHVLKMAK